MPSATGIAAGGVVADTASGLNAGEGEKGGVPASRGINEIDRGTPEVHLVGRGGVVTIVDTGLVMVVTRGEPTRGEGCGDCKVCVTLETRSPDASLGGIITTAASRFCGVAALPEIGIATKVLLEGDTLVKGRVVRILIQGDTGGVCRTTGDIIGLVASRGLRATGG